MKKKGLSTVSSAVALGAILLTAGATCAATSADAFLRDCYDTCLVTYTSCVPKCCGLIFCSKKCVTACDGELTGCDGGCRIGCPTCNPDGAFFDTATIGRDGRTLRVSGPLVCPAGGTADIDVTVTQGAGGAIATGHTRVACPDHETTFTVDAKTTATAAFVPVSTAQACGTTRIHSAAEDVDSFQWCRDITLLPEGVQLGE